jgi:hypothetical protein
MGLMDDFTNFVNSLTGDDLANLQSVGGSLADIAAKSLQVSNALIKMQVPISDINTGLDKLVAVNRGIGKSFQEVAKKATFLEQRNSELNKSFGITSNAAFTLSSNLQVTAKNIGISGVQAIKYAGSLKKLLPTMRQQVGANNATYEGLQMVQHAMQAGMQLSEEQANAFTEYAGAHADNASQMLAVAENVAKSVDPDGTMGAMKMITQGIADAGSEIQLQYGRIPGTLEMAVVKAAKLGFTLEDLKGTADNLLDIESSIGQELEYQLLSGHRLVDDQGQSLTNLYRQAALQGDMNKQADIMNKIIKDEGETLENNMFARQEMAKMLGIQEAQLASALQKQKILEKAGEAGITINTESDESIKDAAAQLVKQGKMSNQEFEKFMKDSDTRTTNDILDQLVEVATEQKIYTALTYQQQFAGGVRGELKEQLKDFQNLMMTQNIEQMKNLGKAIRAAEAGEAAVKGNISAENTETGTAAPAKDLFIPAGGNDTIISGDFGAFTLNNKDDFMAAPKIREAISNTNSGNGDMMKFAAAIVAAIQQQTNILSRSDSGYRQGINDYFN